MPAKPKRVQYGVTEPISFGGNEAYDKQCSQSMEQFLLETGENLRESPEQATHRETVICTLGELLQTWIHNEYALLGHSNADDSDDEEEMLKKKNVYFCTFGSYRLGVNAAGADIDALCVGPRIVGRDRFFEGLVPMLRNHRKISKLLAVPGAYVPVIKMCLDGIEIDLVYACINMDFVPLNLNLLEDKLLFGLEEVDMRCLNGSRVTDMILSKLIPHAENFRATLVFLKFWAKRRAVHSNVMGFLPGVAISLLCARVCQLYPDAEPAYLVHKFFHFYGKIWQWPMPIMLTEVYTHHRSDGSEFEVWDPKKNHLHSRDLMPILTPSFPCMNSTYTVSESTLRIMKRELLRGFAITSSMYPAKGESRCSNLQKVWTELCQPSEFFREYKVYLAVVIESGSTPENHDSWKGFVTSKIRKFVGLLERNYPLVLFHPYPVPSHVEVDNALPAPAITASTTTTTSLVTSAVSTSSSMSVVSVTAAASTSALTASVASSSLSLTTTIASAHQSSSSSSCSFAPSSSSSSAVSSCSAVLSTANLATALSTTSHAITPTSPSPGLASLVGPATPPAKITRDTYYIGVEPRQQGQTLYLADSINFFLRMLVMEGQTEDMVANVEVIPAKELRRLLKIPAPPRKKKADGVKEDVKEQAGNGEQKLKPQNGSEEALHVAEKAVVLPEANGSSQAAKLKLEASTATKHEAMRVKREANNVNVPTTATPPTTKLETECAATQSKVCDSGVRSSPQKRRATPNSEAGPAKRASTTTSSNASSASSAKTSADEKAKPAIKPSITIVTTPFKPKAPPTKPEVSVKSTAEQEEKEAKEKRVADKKQELARLRQQLSAGSFKAPEKTVPNSPKNKASTPKVDFLAEDVQSNQASEKVLPAVIQEPQITAVPETVANSKKLELLRMRAELEKKLAEVDEKLTKENFVADSNPVELAEQEKGANKRLRPEVETVSRKIPHLTCPISPRNASSSSSEKANPSPATSLSSATSLTASPKQGPLLPSLGDIPTPKTKEEKREHLARLKQRYAELSHEKQQKLALAAAGTDSEPFISPVINPVSPALTSVSPALTPVSPALTPVSSALTPVSPALMPVSPLTKPISNQPKTGKTLKRPLGKNDIGKSASELEKLPKSVIEIE